METRRWRRGGGRKEEVEVERWRGGYAEVEVKEYRWRGGSGGVEVECRGGIMGWRWRG